MQAPIFPVTGIADACATFLVKIFAANPSVQAEGLQFADCSRGCRSEAWPANGTTGVERNMPSVRWLPLTRRIVTDK